MAESESRTRFRAQFRQDVKDVALRQLEAGGPQAVSVNAAARELGVSGPALYRYFTNRDELLAQLVEDAYDDLTAALAGAGPGTHATAGAYRGWALAQPHRYRLMFTAPVQDFDPHAERLVAAARRAMAVFMQRLGSTDHQRAITGWTLLHGFVSLEIEGNFASMGLDADALFDTQLDAVLG